MRLTKVRRLLFVDFEFFVLGLMVILVLVLVFLVGFFCCLPYIRAVFQRKTHWDDPENDPRWNKEQFQFSPKLPPKSAYNKLSSSNSLNSDSGMGSRAESFRNCNGIAR